MNNRCEKR